MIRLGTDKLVQVRSFQTLLAGGFPGGVDGFGFFEFLDAAGAPFWALFFCAAAAVEAVDEVPVEVAAGVEADVAGNKDHGAVGRGVDADFEQERAVVLHAVEFPAVTEGVEEGLEAAVGVGPVELPGGVAEVAFLGHEAADDAD